MLLVQLLKHRLKKHIEDIIADINQNIKFTQGACKDILISITHLFLTIKETMEQVQLERKTKAAQRNQTQLNFSNFLLPLRRTKVQQTNMDFQ